MVNVEQSLCTMLSVLLPCVYYKSALVSLLSAGGTVAVF